MYGLSDLAIRNYELRNRFPSEGQLIKIAEVLECDASALVDCYSLTIFEFRQIVFDYKEESSSKPFKILGVNNRILLKFSISI